jgi:hypothetical protein
MPDLFAEQDNPADVERLLAAGWRRVPYYGQTAWQSPDGKRMTQYAATAIKWLEDDNAAS